MARVKYLKREQSANQAIFDRLERERKVPTANVFLALTQTPNILDGFLTYANSVRDCGLDPKLREMAILTVGHVTHSKYEVAHHQSHAEKAGVTPAQRAEIASFEKSSLFDAKEKAVMAFAKESTLNVDVSDAVWNEAAKHLSETEMIALTINVAWYNSGVRIMGALSIDLEPGYE
ncbi:MAG: carboxymuconolactone decarboxylase family protein [Pseudomonadota bacterium]